MITLRINGVERRFDGDPSTPLLWFLRDELGLTGTSSDAASPSAARARCISTGRRAGVHHDHAGRRRQGRGEIEGLSAAGDHALQRAWIEHQVPQCGYCQGGQIMQAAR